MAAGKAADKVAGRISRPAIRFDRMVDFVGLCVRFGRLVPPAGTLLSGNGTRNRVDYRTSPLRPPKFD